MDRLPEPRVELGAIVALRLFDIAYAIDLAAAERVWASRAQTGSSRSQLSQTPAKAVAFDVPPVVLTLDPLPIRLGTETLTAQVTARLYDFGVIALALRVPATGLAWDDYVRRVNAVDLAVGADAPAAPWASLLAHLREVLAPALQKPSPATVQEDYLLAIVQRWSEPLNAAELQARVDLVPLLSGDRRALSEGARRDLLRHRYSYYEDDLVVLTWDRAFICEPRGDSDVVDVLEVANAQLLELRYYDELLDAELPRMYDLVEAARGATLLSRLSPRRYADLARSLYALVAEVTELTEKVDNALQVTEDVYLARIYSTALEQFRVPNVSAAVDRKLAIIRDTYAALYDEASSQRGALMEAAIVILILVELLLALLRH